MISFYNTTQSNINYRQRYLSRNYSDVFNTGNLLDPRQIHSRQRTLRKFMINEINSQEPHPLDYYRKQYYTEYDSPINYWNRLLARVPENITKRYIYNLKKRTFNKLRQNLITSKRTKIAILNYIDFKKLTREPDYLEVIQSSAGIQGWATAGPYHLIES
jgi:transposase